MQAKASRIRVERGLYKRGDSYEACATPPGSTQVIWEVLGSVNLSEARRLRDDFVARVKGRKVVAGKVKFKQAADEWLATQDGFVASGDLRPNTVNGYRNSVDNHLTNFNNVVVSNITADSVVAWKQKRLASGAAQGTVRRDFQALRLILAFSVRKGYAPVNVADLLDRRERPKAGLRRERHLSRDEITKALNKAGDLQLMIATLIFTGLRIGELLKLRWVDIDFEAGTLHTGSKTAAGYRDVILMNALAKALKAHKLASEFSQPQHFVFSSRNGTMLDPHNARRDFRKAMKRAKLKGVTPHVCRHTFASILIAQGHDVLFVAGQMGHADPAFTLRQYGHLFDAARHAEKMRQGLDDEFGQAL